MRMGVPADQSNSDLDALRECLCEYIEDSLSADGVERLVHWIDSQRDTFSGSDFCDTATLLFNRETPAKAVVAICEELCSQSISIQRLDDSPNQKIKITRIRKEISNITKPLHAAESIIREAWKISEENYCNPPLPGDPERLTEEELKTISNVIGKAIGWNESHLLSEGPFDATLRLPEKGTGKPGRQELNPILSSLILKLGDLFCRVGLNKAESSRLIAAWISHFADLGHSWLTEYDGEGRRNERTPQSIEVYLRRHNRRY